MGKIIKKLLYVKIGLYAEENCLLAIEHIFSCFFIITVSAWLDDGHITDNTNSSLGPETIEQRKTPSIGGKGSNVKTI